MSQQQTTIVGIVVVVVTRDTNSKNVTRRFAPLTLKQERSVLNFVQHRCHGGRLTLQDMPEKQRIIVPP